MNATQWRCPNCDVGNPVGTKYCEQCGERLTTQCLKCHAVVYAGASHCGKCGADLDKFRQAWVQLVKWAELIREVQALQAKVEKLEKPFTDARSAERAADSRTYNNANRMMNKAGSLVMVGTILVFSPLGYGWVVVVILWGLGYLPLWWHWPLAFALLWLLFPGLVCGVLWLAGRETKRSVQRASASRPPLDRALFLGKGTEAVIANVLQEQEAIRSQIRELETELSERFSISEPWAWRQRVSRPRYWDGTGPRTEEQAIQGMINNHDWLTWIWPEIAAR